MSGKRLIDAADLNEGDTVVLPDWVQGDYTTGVITQKSFTSQQGLFCLTLEYGGDYPLSYMAMSMERVAVAERAA